jgi:hypothetical protein
VRFSLGATDAAVAAMSAVTRVGVDVGVRVDVDAPFGIDQHLVSRCYKCSRLLHFDVALVNEQGGTAQPRPPKATRMPSS